MKYFRRNIHRFYNLHEEQQSKERYALIVSENERCADNLISIIIFSDTDNVGGLVEVTSDFGTKYINPELVTYCNKKQLGDNCGIISEDAMKEIDNGIIKGLGLFSDTEQERKFYKTAYEGLVNRLIS